MFVGLGCAGLVGLFMLLGIVGMLMPGSNEPARPVAKPRPVAVVGATDLWRAFSSNQLAAKREFGGKLIAVEGPVESTGTEIMGNDYVCLGGPLQVQCLLKGDRESDTAASLRRGERVRIMGKCSDSFIGVVILRDCEFL